jgi:hypothetical protein
VVFLASDNFPAVFDIEGELGSRLFVSSFKPGVSFEQIVNDSPIVIPDLS